MFYLDLNIKGEMKRSLSVCLTWNEVSRLSYFDLNTSMRVK